MKVKKFVRGWKKELHKVANVKREPRKEKERGINDLYYLQGPD